MRGRKGIGESAKTEMLSIRLTKKEKEFLDANNEAKQDLVKNLREDLKQFMINNGGI